MRTVNISLHHDTPGCYSFSSWVLIMLYTKKETTFFWTLEILPIKVLASYERLVGEISGKNNIFFLVTVDVQ